MTDNEEIASGLFIITIPFLVVIAGHFVLGTLFTHISIIIIGIICLFFNRRHYIKLEIKSISEITAKQEKKDAENRMIANEKLRRKEEKEKTIKESGKTKATTYIADIRRLVMRLDGSNKNATQIAMAIDEILNSISADQDIDRNILSSDNISEETQLMREYLEQSLLRDNIVMKRFNKIL